MIRELYINNLHHDLSESSIKEIFNKNKKLLIEYDAFNNLIKTNLPNFKKVSNKHILIYGCINWLQPKHLHKGILQFRKQYSKNLEKEWKSLERQKI